MNHDENDFRKFSVYQRFEAKNVIGESLIKESTKKLILSIENFVEGPETSKFAGMWVSTTSMIITRSFLWHVLIS